jgi:hypothetical protein
MVGGKTSFTTRILHLNYKIFSRYLDTGFISMIFADKLIDSYCSQERLSSVIHVLSVILSII